MVAICLEISDQDLSGLAGRGFPRRILSHAAAAMKVATALRRGGLYSKKKI